MIYFLLITLYAFSVIAVANAPVAKSGKYSQIQRWFIALSWPVWFLIAILKK